MTIETDEPPLRRVVIQAKKSLAYTKKTLSKLGEIYSKSLRQLKRILKNEKKLVFNFGLLFVLAIIPWVSEASYNREMYTDLKNFTEPIDPINTGKFAAQISQYTPGAQANADEMALALMSKNDIYSLDQQLSINTDRNIDEPQRQEATYTVQAGETITQIAEKFGLHVASVLDANSIKAEELKKVKEGTVLVIPSTDTSSSDEWLVAVNKADQAEKAAAEKKRQEELKKQQVALAKKNSSKAYAASSTSYSSSSGYSSVDNGDLAIPPLSSNNGISQGFGRGHTGIDFRCNIGTTVFAAGSGKVVVTSGGWSGGYGNQIVIDHGGGRMTRYAHLSSINVSAGDTVGRGQVIGNSGNTGRSTGPHLHFEVIINGQPVSPY